MPRSVFRPSASPFKSALHRAASAGARSQTAQRNWRSRSASTSRSNVETKSPLRQRSVVNRSSDDIDSPNKDTLMSLIVRGDKLGCALYSPHTCKILLLEDLKMHTRSDATTRIVPRADGETDMDSHSETDGNVPAEEHTNDTISMLIQRFHPTFVLTSNTNTESMLSVLKGELDELDAVLQYRPQSDFSIMTAKAILQDLNVAFCASDTAASHKRSGEAATLRMLDEYPLSSACAGALLSHMQRINHLASRQDSDDDDQHETLPVLAVETFDLSESMSISPEVAVALGVFSKESHATVFSEKTKEGLSLYSLLSTGQSASAKALLMRWLSFPSMSIDVLNGRLDAVQILAATRNKPGVDALRKVLQGLRNIHLLAARMVADKADVGTWKRIADFAGKAAEIRTTCCTLYDDRNASIFQRIAYSFNTAQLAFIDQTINAIVDWEESRMFGRVCVNRGLDSDLDRQREMHANLPAMMAYVSEQFRDTYGRDIGREHNLSVDYFPQVGYLVGLHRRDERQIDNETVDVGKSLDWTYQYSSDVKAFFKEDKTREMDATLGDLYSIIVGQEIAIVQQLQEEITKHLSALVVCGDLMAELECLLGFARIAETHKYTRPELVEQPTLDIQDGRHPLQELIVDMFVPNPTSLEGGHGVGTGGTISEDDFQEVRHSILIVTGANACGKSVYLKQNALIAVMAQIGSFVPARHARVGLVDKILACVQLDESVTTNEGSFQTDMRQVSDALQRCTRRSMILFDEMGKGTSPSDGAALFAATIRYLLRRGQECPRVLAATHFHEVFHDDLLAPSLPYTASHMQIVMSSDKGDETQSNATATLNGDIVFLYNLRPGLELHSHATECERMFGLDGRIVNRAEYIANLSRQHKLGSLKRDIERQVTSAEEANQADDLAKAELIARAFAEWDIDADVQQVAQYGEVLWLDPVAKLERVVNEAFQKEDPSQGTLPMSD